MPLRLLLLSLLSASALPCHGGLFGGGPQRYTHQHRVLHHLVDKEPDCDGHQRPGGPQEAVSSAPSPLSIDGSLKLTTAPAGPETPRSLKVCGGATPLVPFGELIRDRRGIQFWYLRLRVTRLVPGQRLVVITLDKESMDSLIVNSDQRFDITADWPSFPADLRLRYRYARLFWKSTQPAAPENTVNITVSRYAMFADSLNATERRYLCDRYANFWCEPATGRGGGVCVAPGACSHQADCFDEFSEPNKCPDGGFWIGSGAGGNYSTGGSGGVGGSGSGGSWLSRNFPWLAFAAIPVALLFALAKICAQKRELDIDDDYDYKLSCSDYRGEGATAAGRDDDEEAGDSDHDNSEDDGDYSWRAGERRRSATRASVPQPPQPPQPLQSPQSPLAATQPSLPPLSPASPPPPPPQPTPPVLHEATDSTDSEADAPPPPPRQRPRQQANSLCRLSEESDAAAATAAAADACGGEKQDRKVELEAENGEEAEFLNCSLLRNTAVNGCGRGVDSMELTIISPTLDNGCSGRAARNAWGGNVGTRLHQLA